MSETEGAMRRLAYLGSGSRTARDPRLRHKLLDVGYSGWIETGNPLTMHAMIDGHRFEYRDEPEYHPELEPDYYRDWLEAHENDQRLVAYAEIPLAKARHVFDQHDLMGYVAYPGYPRHFFEWYTRFWKLRKRIRRFLRDTQGPVVGTIQTFTDKADVPFPSTRWIRWQEFAWIEQAGDRLFAIAHFAWDVDSWQPGWALKDHSESWPGNL